MEKIKDINEALEYLKQGDIITCQGNDLFILKANKVACFVDGSNYSLNIPDFIDLYKNNTFYLYEESVEIDLDKDEDYYRYYHK